jgi:hypothetical protein
MAADCCDNCKEGKVCCSVEEHSHSTPARQRGGNPRTRRTRFVSNPTVDVGPLADALRSEQIAASARVDSSMAVRENPSGQGTETVQDGQQGLTRAQQQRKMLLQAAGVVAIGGGLVLGYMAWKRMR